MMPGYTEKSRLSDVLDNPAARAVVAASMAGLVNSPMLAQLRNIPIGLLVERDPVLTSDSAARDAFWASLASIDDTTPPRPVPQRIDPDPRYESDDVARASAGINHPETVRPFELIEIRLLGPSHGNPFVDVDLHAAFRGPTGSVTAGGFYNGDGEYVIRFLPEEAGEWHFSTSSTARSLDGLSGSVIVTGLPIGHGPVRVADTFHFAHADGTRHVPVGTTAYAWTHQPVRLQEQTLRTLESSPFNKIRMCVFPKSYLYNTQDPDRYPFPRADESSWDVTRFDTAYFAQLEERIRQLDAMGVQADLILFHPYDRWGFADLGAAVDDRYLTYAVRRLAAFPNVWWSMANEYDLMWSKSTADWERLASVVVENDPTRHLLSIHNCFAFYDYTRPWITHCSMQRVDVYRTAENTDDWRKQWGKPIVIDECGYEGDLDQGWGNLTGEEMVRRFWEGAVRGGYVGHGETFHRADEVIWWSKGGELHGSSVERIGFLRQVVEDAGGAMTPLPSEWDAPWGGVADRHILIYFGFNRPSFRTLCLPPGLRVSVDVIDTWNMTVDRLAGVQEGTFTVNLPGRPYMALRLIADA